MAPSSCKCCLRVQGMLSLNHKRFFMAPFFSKIYPRAAHKRHSKLPWLLSCLNFWCWCLTTGSPFQLNSVICPKEGATLCHFIRHSVLLGQTQKVHKWHCKLLCFEYICLSSFQTCLPGFLPSLLSFLCSFLCLWVRLFVGSPSLLPSFLPWVPTRRKNTSESIRRVSVCMFPKERPLFQAQYSISKMVWWQPCWPASSRGLLTFAIFDIFWNVIFDPFYSPNSIAFWVLFSGTLPAFMSCLNICVGKFFIFTGSIQRSAPSFYPFLRSKSKEHHFLMLHADSLNVSSTCVQCIVRRLCTALHTLKMGLPLPLQNCSSTVYIRLLFRHAQDPPEASTCATQSFLRTLVRSLFKFITPRRVSR